MRQKQLFSGLFGYFMLQLRAVARTNSESSSICHCIQLDAAQGRRASYEVNAVMLTASVCALTAAENTKRRDSKSMFRIIIKVYVGIKKSDSALALSRRTGNRRRRSK